MRDERSEAVQAVYRVVYSRSQRMKYLVVENEFMLHPECKSQNEQILSSPFHEEQPLFKVLQP